MSQVDQPTVSVCIPVYNGADFIRAAIDSVFAQTMRFFELIVLDNQSTDATPNILEQYCDERMRVVRHATNIGATANFNAALHEARGDWIKILCADDLLYPSCLERQLAWATAQAIRPVMICGARDIVDAKGRHWLRRAFPATDGMLPGPEAIRRTVRAGTNLFGEPAAVLMRRETVLRTDGFDPSWRFCMDLDVWVKLLQHGDVFVSREALCAFRVSPQSWSMALVGSQAREFGEWLTRRHGDGLLSVQPGDLRVGRLKAYLLMLQRWFFYGLLKWRG